MDEPDAPPDAPAGRRARRRAARAARGPGGTENVSRREYLGCLAWAAGFLVLVVVSFSVGVVLRPDRQPDRVTLASTRAYVLVGSVDEEDEPCIQLYRPGDEDVEGAEVSGQCGIVGAEEGEAGDRYRITSADLDDGTTVAFGPAPRRAESVRLRLADGRQQVVEVRQASGIDLRWFVYASDQAIDGPAQMLDGAGDPLTPTAAERPTRVGG